MKTQHTRLETGDWRSATEALGSSGQTRPMPRSIRPLSSGFTLIEMIIVIGIILILAAMVFPITGAVKKIQVRTRARGELTQMETAIEAYKAKLGFYPPDNGTNYHVNQLYYELLGTTNIGTATAPVYQTLDGSSRITAASLSTFITNISGFMNCARGGGGDEGPTARPFIKGLKPNQWLTVTNMTGLPTPIFAVLGAGLDGWELLQAANSYKINPWRYNSSNPRYNPKSFDLWIDVLVGGKINRICNWSEQPLVVSTPY